MSTMKKSDEYCTPPWLFHLVLRLTGGKVDLDPAAHPSAISTALACSKYYKKDGERTFNESWDMHSTIWLNPPYSRGLCRRFVEKFCDWRPQGKAQGFVLLNSCTETQHYQDLLFVCDMALFFNKRIKFIHDNKEAASPRFGQTLFYRGFQLDAFEEVFIPYGTVVQL